MKNHRRIPTAVALGAFLAVAVLLPACTRDPGSATTVKLMIWGAPDEVATVQSYCDKFEAANPGIRVKIEHAPDMGYRQKLQMRIAGDDMPDVFYVGHDDFPELRALGALADLTDHLEADEGLSREDFYEEVFRGFVEDDRVYGIAKDFAVLVLYYNRDLFDKWGLPYPNAEWTWSPEGKDDFVEACRRLTVDDNGDGVPEEYGFVVETWLGEWIPWVWQNGGEIMGEDEDGTERWLLDDPRYLEKNAEAIQFLADLMNVHKVAPTRSAAKQQGTSELFKTGRVGMCTYGRWMCMQFKHLDEFDWNVTVLPKRERRAATLFSVCYGIAERSEHKDEAWKLVSFLTGRDGQVATAESGQAIPSMRAIATSDHFLAAPALEGTEYDPQPNLDSIPYSRPFTETVHFQIINDVLTRSLDPVWDGTITAKEGIAAVGRALREDKRILKDDGTFVTNAGERAE